MYAARGRIATSASRADTKITPTPRSQDLPQLAAQQRVQQLMYPVLQAPGIRSGGAFGLPRQLPRGLPA
jgi:hypothetical protein